MREGGPAWSRACAFPAVDVRGPLCARRRGPSCRLHQPLPSKGAIFLALPEDAELGALLWSRKRGRLNPAASFPPGVPPHLLQVASQANAFSPHPP